MACDQVSCPVPLSLGSWGGSPQRGNRKGWPVQPNDGAKACHGRGGGSGEMARRPWRIGGRFIILRLLLVSFKDRSFHQVGFGKTRIMQASQRRWFVEATEYLSATN